MRITLIGAAASVALVSATAIAVAQMPGGAEPPGKMQGPGAQGPGSQGPGSQGPAMRQPGGKAEGSQTPGAGKGEAQRAPDAGEGKGKRESQGAPSKEQPKATESQREKSTPKATQGQPEKAQPKASQGQPEKGQPKSTEGQPEKGQPKASQGQPEKGQKSTQGQQQTTRVQVSEQQRSGVRERLFKDGKFQKTRLNVRVDVGTRVPRSVRLLPLPLYVVDLAPSYRGYNYIVLEDDTICIIDPQSYDVVDVIAVGSQRAEGPRGPRLSLSQDQMRFISANVPREPRTNVRVRLALGAEVPRDVELLAFPPEVVSQLPELAGYRYIVADERRRRRRSARARRGPCDHGLKSTIVCNEPRPPLDSGGFVFFGPDAVPSPTLQWEEG